MRPVGSPGAQSPRGIDQVFLGEEVWMSNMHYDPAVDVERALQYMLAWRIHSFCVGRVIWSITGLRRLGPHPPFLLITPILEQSVISVAV